MRVIPSFRRWEHFLEKEVTFNDIGSVFHKKAYLLFSLMISDGMGMDEDWTETLCVTAVFHNSRRHDDWLDTGHGDCAASYYKMFCGTLG